MSPLALIQRSMQRKMRLNQAQFLMASAYRGISYTRIPADIAPKPGPCAKTYRGIEYVS